MTTSKKDYVVVVAIDFGTTYSGYAYSFRDKFLKDKKNHLAHIIVNYWNSGGDFLSEKTPTTLLLNKNKEFVNFGYEAETKYGGMSEEERKDHYYFRRFKMMLYDKEGQKLAGISKNSIRICLEPEAAAIYCKWLQIERDDELLKVMKPGHRFLVIDAGGGTIDMTMQEVRDDEKLVEICRAQGGDWGGIYVDAEFKQMLENCISKPVIEGFRMKHTGDYIEMFRSFEQKKREKLPRKNVRIYIPLTLLESVDNIDKLNEDQGLKESVKWARDKVHINVQKFKEFFNNVIDKIVVKVEGMLVSDTTQNTKTIIMVGGFSASEMLQQRIKDCFPSCTVVIPPECGLAVLKGAVLYGHDPDIIAARIMKYTYGVGTNTKFIENKHPESKKKLINGEEYCTDKFDVHVEKDDLVHCNEETEKTYFPIYDDQTSVKFKVFATDVMDPQYTDDKGCREIGSLVVPMPNTRGGTNRKVVAKFKFGASKITVTGIDETSKKSVDVKLDFLEETG
ncbi:heat shock 70 kDa protein 12A-like isoform X2 [Crassostrea virginica]